MAERKTPNKGYQKLKSDLSAGNIGQVYIFYGEESYLREYYLGEIKKKLVPAGFEEFNYHRLSGKTLTMQELNEAVEAMPMMAERTLIVVTDCDLFKLPEEQRTALIALLNDFPPYCCLVFVYDLIEYKPSKTYKKLYEALDKNAQSVKFEAQERSDLINWIGRRFRALGKGIDAQTAEHLIFTCGALMTGLVPRSSPTVRGSFYRYYAVKYTLSKGACNVSVLLPFRVPVIPPALLPALCAIPPCRAPAARAARRSS